MTDAYRGVIRLVLFDVDGVLTDGTLLVGPDGEIAKPFNVRDGLAVALLRSHGVRSGVLSGKSSASLTYRIRELKLDFAAVGRLDKLAAIGDMLDAAKLTMDQVAYVGDDVVDLPLAGRVGRFYAPADAHSLVLERADYVLSARGGAGAGREAAEHILLSSGMSLEDCYSPLIGSWSAHHAVQ